MKIVMLTNTYLPHVGGVANSVSSFVEAFRARGHRTVVIAPKFEGCEGDEEDVIRVPAIQHFNGSDFSYRLPAPWKLVPKLDALEPDVVHAHHPFLLGDTAVRIASFRGLPLVFTHHTMYERYTHYVPGDSGPMRNFVIRMATDFANLCDHIIAPSESIAEVLKERGVVTPISAIPTGIDVKKFAQGDGDAARRTHGVPEDAFVVGHVGRLAPEKNLAFLSEAVVKFLRRESAARFLLVGGGPMEAEIRRIFAGHGLEDRLHMMGPLRGQVLIDAYHAMDVFAFASETETQGMVVAEAMAAGLPVVGVDAPGVREVVKDRENGRLLPVADAEAFADAIEDLANRSPDDRERLKAAAQRTAEGVSLERCADRLLKVYQGAKRRVDAATDVDASPWAQGKRLIEAEWSLWTTRAGAAVETLTEQLAKPSGSVTHATAEPT